MKTFALSLCLIFLISMSHAQKAYFKASVGYALPAVTQSIGENSIQTYNTDTQENTSTLENVSASFGAGLNINVGGGFMFSKNLGVDLNIIFQQGKQYEVVDRFAYTGSIAGKDETIRTVQGSGIFLNPSLVISPGAGKMMPYGRLGVVIGSPKVKGEEAYYNDTDGTDTQEQEWEYKKGTAFGVQGAVGFNFMVGNSIDIFAELSFTGMTYYPGEYELTKNVRNGNDQLESTPVYEKKTKFVKEIDLTEQQQSDEPSKELRIGLPYSSVALQVGIRYILGGREVE